MRKVCTALCIVMLAACSTPERRMTWVDPSTVKDAATYEKDYFECRSVAYQIFDEEKAARRDDAVRGAVVGAVVGAALGHAVAPSGSKGEITRFGAVAGGVAGAASPSGAPLGEVLLGAMRECLRGRGYRTLR